MSKMRNIDTAILGAGVSGLSLASFLKNKNFLIFESENEVGGYCKSTIRGDYVWDYAGHFFHFRYPEIKNYLLELIESEVIEVNKKSDIYYKGNLIDFPFQDNIQQLSAAEYIECLEDFNNKKSVTQSVNFKEFVISNLGKAICDKFIIPYNEKLYACDLSKLDFDTMGRFFPNKVGQKSYNDTFIYPEKGCFEFIKSLLKRVDTNSILLNSEIIELDIDKKTLYTKSEKIKFDKLISTIPFNKLLGISKYECNLNELESNKVVVYNLGFQKAGKSRSHWTYFPGEEVFYRVGFYNNIFQKGKLSLYVEIGLKEDESIDETSLLERVLSDLRKCQIVDEDNELVDYQFLVLKPAYVHITKKSKEIYEEWCSFANQKGVFSIGRYGSWTYCSIEDNIIQAKILAEQIGVNTFSS